MNGKWNYRSIAKITHKREYAYVRGNESYLKIYIRAKNTRELKIWRWPPNTDPYFARYVRNIVPISVLVKQKFLPAIGAYRMLLEHFGIRERTSSRRTWPSDSCTWARWALSSEIYRKLRLITYVKIDKLSENQSFSELRPYFPPSEFTKKQRSFLFFRAVNPALIKNFLKTLF